MRFAQGPRDAFSLSGRLGAWYLNLDKICRKRDRFPIVWQIFSDAVLDNFDGVLRGQSGLTPSPGKVRQFLGLAEAARSLQVSVQAIQDAVSKGHIKGRVGREGMHYRVTLISRTECERIQVSRADFLSASAAAARLKVSQAILKNLVTSGVLDSDDGWHTSIFKSGPIARASLSMLEERLSGFVNPKPIGETLKFTQMTARRTVDNKALIALYQAIFSGVVCPVGRDSLDGLGGFMFCAAEVKQYLGSAALMDAMTLTQVEAVTGFKYDSLSRWTQLGLLHSRSVVLQGRVSRVVSVRDLSEFRKQWIPVSDIASAVDSKGSAITTLLKNLGIGIHGQTVQENGPRRGGLIRLQDLSILAGLAPRKKRGIEPVFLTQINMGQVTEIASLNGADHDHA